MEPVSYLLMKMEELVSGLSSLLNSHFLKLLSLSNIPDNPVKGSGVELKLIIESQYIAMVLPIIMFN